MSKNFASIVVCDFEYEATAGELPNVLCMVAYLLDENLRHARTVRMWRGDFGPNPPFDIGSDTLFVAYKCMGGNDLLHDAGLGIPCAHFSINIQPIWRPVMSYCPTTPTKSVRANANG